MAAYAAVISLKHTIKFSLLNYCRIPFVSSTREMLESAYDQTTSLQQVIEKFNQHNHNSSSKRLEDLEGQIRDCAHKLEDFLLLHELQDKYEDEDEVRLEITSFIETVMKMKKDYVEELSKLPSVTQEEGNDDDDGMDCDVVMVRSHSDGLDEMRRILLEPMRPNDLYFLSLFGEVGNGRTVVAKTVFEELGIKAGKDYFDCCAWVTVGMESEYMEEILIRILAQLDNPPASLYEDEDIDEDGDEGEDEDEDDGWCSYLNKVLNNRRYMIVLDDVRDTEVVEYLRWSLPDQSNGSMVLFTTNSIEVNQFADFSKSFAWIGPEFQEIIANVLILSIFDDASMPPEFEEAANKIIDNCGGATLVAAKTLLFLMTTEKTVQKWSSIASDRDNPIFMVEDELSEVSKIKTEMQTYDMHDDIRGLFTDMITFSSHFDTIKMTMYPERLFSKMRTISVWGMAGIGKTTFVRTIFKDESISYHFDHRAWVTLGPTYQTGDILIDILAQVYLDISRSDMKEDEKLVRNLCELLSSKRCLIVLDDLWSKDPMHHLKNLFPEIKGVVLVTTRLAQVAKNLGLHDSSYQMELLDEEESWLVLSQKVFGGDSCPFELEKAGRKIAQKCDGLPLLIVTVADQLLKLELSLENWNNVASGRQKSVFINAHNQISKTLLPSYQMLPHHLKACFLYLGVFCELIQFSTSKLINLWIAEGFLETNGSQMIEDVIAESLGELVDRTLLMAYYKVSSPQIKTCRLHSVFWHLSNTQAVENKFFHAMNTYDDCLIESIKSHRRLCIRNSSLLGMKDVQTSMASITLLHSLLCVGPFQQYPVPLSFDWRLLRVMNALSIRLYEFPVEVVALVHLRYLGLTCNGNIPTSISNLWKLQYLVVKRYMNVTSSTSSWPLPVEIWDMKELKHLQVMGGYLPDHKGGDGLLNLSVLLDVCAENCREEVLEWLPNLRKLGIRIQLSPNDEGSSFHYLKNISRLQGLESLKCIVVNPQFRSEDVRPLVSTFPSSLKKLSLSGMGYGWEDMSIIGELEYLESLKLKSYAFRGPKWDMDLENKFVRLKYLLVEDTDLVQWRVSRIVHSRLMHLSIKHCYKLKELPVISKLYPIQKIEVVDCNPLAVMWAEQTDLMIYYCQVNVDLSWLHPNKNDSQ